MWCQQCGQDVPAVSAADGVPAACPRCQHPTARTPEPRQAEVVAEVSDEWQADRRLRQIGRSLRAPLSTSRSSMREESVHWVDTLAIQPQATSDTHAARTVDAGRETRARRAGERRVQIVAWLALVFGLGLAAGGVGLMGMGMFGEQTIFWQWGVGVTLAGQAILIAGLVKVLMTLWGSTRAATQRLSDMQQDLAEVGRTAESIIAQRPGGPSGFYGELARGASPALLMANLKGQIDHLATRLHHDV